MWRWTDPALRLSMIAIRRSGRTISPVSSSASLATFSAGDIPTSQNPVGYHQRPFGRRIIKTSPRWLNAITPHPEAVVT